MDYTRDAVLIHELAEEKRMGQNFAGISQEMAGGHMMGQNTGAGELLDTNGVVGGNQSHIHGGNSNSNSNSDPALNSTAAILLESIIDYLNKTNVSDLTNFGMGSGEFNDTDYVPYPERPETYIVPVLFAIIFIIGVLGNGTLIVIFLKHRNMRNVPNMYICSLAVGDILVIFFCVPFTSTVYTVESWPYGLLVCKFSEFIKDVSIGVSVFTLTALSADRYFAIVDPMRKLPGRRATRITCITIAGIWLVSLVIALPSVLFSYIRKFEHENRSFLICYPYPPELGPNYPKIIVMFKFLVYYAVPLCFIASFYVIMAHHLVLSTRNMPGEAQGQAKQIQGRKKVAKMVLSFVVIFALCFFPNHLFFVWFYYVPNAEQNFNDYWNVVRILGFCLSFINSCINPITLYCVSGTFRKHFNKHLFCCICDPDGRGRGTGGRGGACGLAVSMSNSNYHMCNERVNGRNGLCRHQSAMNGPKRGNCTWDTHSTASHHQLLSMTTLNAHCTNPNCNPHQHQSHNHNQKNNQNQQNQQYPNSHHHRSYKGAGAINNPNSASAGLLMNTCLDGIGSGSGSGAGTGTGTGTGTGPGPGPATAGGDGGKFLNSKNAKNANNCNIIIMSNNTKETNPISQNHSGSGGSSPSSQNVNNLRGPSGRLNNSSGANPGLDTEYTMTSFIQNVDARSLESLK